MRLRLAQPTALVDINGIKGLDQIKVEGSKVHVGALVRHVQIQNSDELKDKVPLLAEIAGEVGDNQVRNMGTMGGVIAHADAAGDYPTIALMLDAEIVTNKRKIQAKDFFKDIFTTPLAANEIVTEVVFPVADGPHKYIKFRRRLFDWAIVGAAAQKMNGDWRIGLTNVGPIPGRAKAVEDAFHKAANPEGTAQPAPHGLNRSAAAHADCEGNYARQPLHTRRLGEGEDRRTAEREIFSSEFLLRRPLLDAIDNDDPTPPVLLIDEIDRSDEEFEAFLLELLSDFQISIPEIGTIKAKKPPFVVITSNRTREVHDALKRRCLYHWIDYPDLETEVQIVRALPPASADGLAREVSSLVQSLPPITPATS